MQGACELKYGNATVGLHTDAVNLGVTVTQGAAMVAPPQLGGSTRLKAEGSPLFTLIDFSGCSRVKPVCY